MTARRLSASLLVLALCAGPAARLAPEPASTAVPQAAAPAAAPAAALPTGAPAPKAAVTASPAAAAAAIPLKDVAARLKCAFSWDPLTGVGSLSSGSLTASLGLGNPWLVLNYSEALAIDPPREDPKGPLVSERTVALLSSRLEAQAAAKKGHFTIAAILIDPGHGGKDSGAVGEHDLPGGKKLRVVEKDLALDVSKRIHAALQARFPDKRILISRAGDSYPTLDDRVEMANSVELGPDEAIIYVSIHANASFNKNAKGFEVWYLNPDYRRTLVRPDGSKDVSQDIAPILNAMLEEEFTTESIMLARKIAEGLDADIGARSPNRGVRAEEWFVVRNARMPSVLVEMGFVTNPDEARLLGGDDYLKQLSDGIYTGIVDFVGYFETMRGPSEP